MLNKIIPLLVFFSVIILSGCVSITIDSCIDDGYCSAEELLQGCSDCIPDLVAGESLLFSYADESLEVGACIANIGGPLHSQIPLTYTVEQSGRTYTFTEEVSFSTIERYLGNFDLEILENEIIFSGSITRDIEDKVCFSHFLQIPDLNATVTLHINPQETVRERDYSNNIVTSQYMSSATPVSCPPGFEWDGTQCVEICVGCELLEISIKTAKSVYSVGERVMLE